jgi:membrane-associated HD superfamily phosphohydrolase
MQEAQQMFSISGFGILGMGLVIIIVLLVVGFREKEDLLKKERFIRVAGILFGLLIIVTGCIWTEYMRTAYFMPLSFGSLIILTIVSSIGGLISGISCYIPID